MYHSVSLDSLDGLRAQCSSSKDVIWDWLMKYDLQGFGAYPKGSTQASLDYVLPLMSRVESFKSEFAVSVTYQCKNADCTYSILDENCPLCLFAQDPGTLNNLIQQTISYRCESNECAVCEEKTLAVSDVKFGSFVFISMNGVKDMLRLLAPEEKFKFGSDEFELTGAVWNDTHLAHYIPIVKVMETNQFAVLDDLKDNPECFDTIKKCFESLNVTGLDKICWLIYKKLTAENDAFSSNNESAIEGPSVCPSPASNSDEWKTKYTERKRKQNSESDTFLPKQKDAKTDENGSKQENVPQKDIREKKREQARLRQQKRRSKLTGEQKEKLKLADSEQKARTRSKQTAEEKEQSKAKQREQTARTRSKQTAEEKEQSKPKQREQMARTRSKQTTEEKEKNKAYQREQMARTRSKQTAEEKEQSKPKQREQTARTRSKQTTEEKEKNKAYQREQMARTRSKQTAEEKEQSKAKQREQTARTRSKQTAEEKEQSKAKQREQTARTRSKETTDEKEQSKAKQREQMARSRTRQNSDQKRHFTRQSMRKMTEMRTNRTTDEMEQLNIKDKQRMQQTRNETKANFDAHVDQTINSVIARALSELNSEIYASEINAALSEYCACCHKILFEDRTYKVSLLNKSTTAVSVDQTSSLCSSCKTNLDKDQIPAKAVINDLYVEPVPNVLKTLTFLERRFVSRVLTYMTMIVLPSGGQYGQKGMAIHFPSDPESVVKILPQNCEKSGIVCVSGKYESYIRPMAIFAALEWLKKYNQFYKDLTINYAAFKIDPNLVNEALAEIEETGTIPLDYECPEISVDEFLKSDGSKVKFPRSTCQPVSLFHDPTGSTEAQAFVCLYPKGNYTYGQAKQTAPKLTLLQFLQSRLLNIDSRFRLDIPFLITAVNRYEASAAKSLVECYMRIRKPQSNTGGKSFVTAGDVRNIKNNADLSDNSLMWLKSIRGSASYWKDNLWNLLAKIKTLGPPEVFVTDSSAEVHWPELRELLEKDMGPLEDMNDAIRKNPVIVALHTKRRFEALLKFICKNKTLGKVDDYHVRVEFQNRGSVHFHCFYWIRDAPSIHKGSSAEQLCAYIDKHIHTTIPDESDPELRELVLSRQIHSHTSYCRKPGSDKCRYRYPRPVCEETRLLNDTDLEKTQTCFYETKRTKESACVNAYNPDILRFHRAHMDIQLVYGAQGLAYYVCKYIMKAEPDELRSGLAKTLNELQHNITTQKGRMLKLAMCVLKCRRMSAQEAAYRICNLPMIYSTREVTKISTLTPDNRVKKLKTIAEIADLPDDRTEIFHDNFIDVYRKRSKELEQLSLFDTASWYRKVSFDTPKSFALIDESAALKRRTKFCCIRTSYLSTGTENYYYSLLLLHCPHRKEEDLIENYESYKDAFMAKHENFNFESITNETFVTEVLETAQKIRVNDLLNERMNEDDDDDETDEVLEEYGGDHATGDIEFNVMRPSADSPEMDLTNNAQEEQEWHSLRVGECSVPNLETKIASLNKDQMRALKYVHKKICSDKEQLSMLLSGEAGSGKSYFLQVLIEWLRLTQSKLAGQDCVMVAAPTGIAAKHINGKTLHSLLKLPIQRKGDFSVSPLSRNTLEKLKTFFIGKLFLIIDESSMVGQRMLIAINMRLCQIYDNDKPFGGINIIFCGDYGQLRPVRDKPTFECRDLFELLNPLWLMQNMRQGNESQWHTLLNNIRNCELNDEDEKLLQSRLFSLKDLESNNAIRIYPTAKMVKDYNAIRQSKLNSNVTKNKAVDIYSANDIAPNCTVDPTDLPEDERECGGLPHELSITENSRVMCIKNIGFGLVNGDMGLIERITYAVDGSVEIIYVKFDDKNAGKELQVNGAVPFERSETQFESHGRQINRYQFPLIPCWAITVHKSQGLTLDEAVVNIGKAIFQPAMSYVALSRVRTIDGVFIEREPMHDIMKAACKPNKAIAELNMGLLYKFREIKRELKNYKIGKLF